MAHLYTSTGTWHGMDNIRQVFGSRQWLTLLAKDGYNLTNAVYRNETLTQTEDATNLLDYLSLVQAPKHLDFN